MSIVTYNLKIKMTPESKEFWCGYLQQASDAYDSCAAYIKEHKLQLNIRLIHDEVYSWMREKYPLLPAQAIIKTYKDVMGAYRSIKKNKHKTDKVPHKKGLNIKVDKRLYSKLTKDGIYLTGEVKNKRKFYEFEPYERAMEMFQKYPTHDPMLFSKNDNVYLAVPFEVPELPVQNDTCVGVDLGLKRMFVTSEGNYYQNKEFRAKKREVRYLKRQLKAKGTKSAKRHLKKLKNKERNMNKAENYRAVEALMKSTDADIFVLEDLKGIKTKTSKNKNGSNRKQHNNAMSQVGIAKFREILTYKAQAAGKRVETVNPAYTSQKDCRTGKRDGVRHGCRYICKDKIVLDADWNAAVNIGLKSKHPVSSSLPIDGKLNPLTGRLKTTSQSWSYRQQPSTSR